MKGLDSTFYLKDKDVELDLSDTESSDKAIVLSMGDPETFLLVGLSAKKARKLAKRLRKQADILEGLR